MATKKISIALLCGLITAGVMVLFIYGTYLAGVKVFLGEIAFLSYGIVILMGAVAALMQKRANGGYITFQEAVKVCFTVFVLGLGVRSLFPCLLVNVIDPHFKQQLLPEIAIRAEKAYRMIGMPEDQLRRQLEADKTSNPFSLSSVLLGLAFAYIVHFFVALLIAAIVKRKPVGNEGI